MTAFELLCLALARGGSLKCIADCKKCTKPLTCKMELIAYETAIMKGELS